MNDLHGGRGTNSQGIENFDLKFGAAEMSFEEVECIFLFRERNKASNTVEGVLSSSGASQMVTGASERDSPNPADLARSLALLREAVPTSQEALSLLLLPELEEPLAKDECCGCCAVAGTHRLSDPPHCVQRGRNYCQERNPEAVSSSGQNSQFPLCLLGLLTCAAIKTMKILSIYFQGLCVAVSLQDGP